MKFASVKPNRLAVVQGGELILIDDALPKGASMIDLIADYDRLRPALAGAVEKGKRAPLDPKQLKAPVENPSKLWAAATNYKRGSQDSTKRAAEGRPERRRRRKFSKKLS